MQESQYLKQRRALKQGAREPAEKKTTSSKKTKGKSNQRKEDEKEYKKIVKEMLLENDRCELNTPVCTGAAQGLHHQKRRGSNYLNRKYLLRSCNACNGYVERNPKYAVEHGLSLSVHKIEPELIKFPSKNEKMSDLTKEQIVALTCKKHVKIFKLSQLGLKNKEVADLVGTNAGHVYNVIKSYTDKPEKAMAAAAL